MPGLNVFFRSDLRKAFFMLVVIKSKFYSESQTRPKRFIPIKDPIDSPILNLFLFGLAHGLLN
jgi:hypothetical protein